MAKERKEKMTGGARCTTTKRGVKLCISKSPISGMKCGKNPRTGLYACAKGKN